MLTIKDLFDLNDTIAAPLFEGKTYAWEVLGELSDYIKTLGATLSLEEYDHPSEGVWIAKDAKVFPSAYLGGPCIIDHEAEILRLHPRQRHRRQKGRGGQLRGAEERGPL